MTDNVTTNTTPTSNATNSSPYTPLSREELAAFMMYNESQMKEISSHMSELISAQSSISADHTKTSQEQMNLITQQMNLTKSFMTVATEQQRAFCDATIKVINRQAATMDKVLTALLEFIPDKISSDTNVSNSINCYSATNPPEAPVSLHDFDGIENPDVWKTKALQFLHNYCFDNNIAINTLSREIYREMKMKYNVSLGESTCRINYISKYPELRKLFIECFEDITSNKKIHTKNESITVNSTPAAIKRILDPLVFEGCNISGILNSIYREMDKYLAPRSLSYIKQEFVKKNGYKYVNTAYIISQYPDLMELFEKVVKSRL